MAMTIKVHEASIPKALDDAMYNAFAESYGIDRAIKLSGDCGEYDVTLYDMEGNRIDAFTSRSFEEASRVFNRLDRLISKKGRAGGYSDSL